MASFNTSGIRFFQFSAASAISAFARVTVGVTGYIQCAGPTDHDVGVTDLDVGPPEVTAAVRLPTCPGSRKMIADTAISAWGYVYKSYSGFCTGALGTALFSVNAQTIGFAAAPSGQLVAATAFGSVLEVIPFQGVV